MENRFYIRVKPKTNNEYKEWYFLNWDGKTYTFYLSHQPESFVEDEIWANALKDLVLNEENIEEAKVCIERCGGWYKRTKKEIEQEMRVIESEREIKSQVLWKRKRL